MLNNNKAIKIKVTDENFRQELTFIVTEIYLVLSGIYKVQFLFVSVAMCYAKYRVISMLAVKCVIRRCALTSDWRRDFAISALRDVDDCAWPFASVSP